MFHKKKVLTSERDDMGVEKPVGLLVRLMLGFAKGKLVGMFVGTCERISGKK